MFRHLGGNVSNGLSPEVILCAPLLSDKIAWFLKISNKFCLFTIDKVDIQFPLSIIPTISQAD